ncbi:MAG: endopeptidase La [Waddliaceae bacterium]
MVNMEHEFDENKLELELDSRLIEALEQEGDSLFKNQKLPTELTIFPVVKRPFFPGMAAPIMIEKGPYYDYLKKISKTKDKCVGLILTKDESVDVYKVKFQGLHEYGVLARLLKIIPVETGGAQVIFNMERRFKIIEPLSKKKPLRAKVEYFEDTKKLTNELKAYAMSITSTIKELLKLNPLFKEELQIFLSHSDFTEPGKLADFAVALTTSSREEMQDILETQDLSDRINKALILLKKELDLTKLQHNINQKIESTINKGQRDFFLREQLKTIKKELGVEKEDKSVDVEKFKERLKGRQLNKEVESVINDEMEKMQVLDPQSAEYGVCRSYLDWLTNLPWGVMSKENDNLAHAKKVLENDHYGLMDIKKRILEFISVGKLSGGVKGSIICLAGPPGVGKTSVGRSIARALNRNFYRFSVGGMRDEAEIKGHRRTYIGAMPGKPVQALKYCKTMNPVIMLDEVDKMGQSYQGDPASALLEVLDPEQNREFVDHYLDVPCDLSNVLFVITANVLESIPEPLLDRMEILRLSGYITQEKVEIATKYLIPRNRKEMGLKATDVSFTKEGIRTIIEGYAREAGVRSLENQIKKILRKVALQIVEESESEPKIESKSHRITATTVVKYLGNPIFTTERFYEETPVGVCTGLAWTAMGGVTLYIEAIKIPAEKTSMKLTGQAGDVMKESSEIAWSYLHGAISQFAPGSTFFEKSQVHLHIPEGATPKDGPSAGVTMVTALLSLLTNTPVKENLGMTGELTLTGKILPIGGVKEKLVAAKRAKLEQIVFPKENKRDFEELPNYLKENITVHFVSNYSELFPIAFPDLEPPLGGE